MNYFIGLTIFFFLLLILEWLTFNSKVNPQLSGTDIESFYNPLSINNRLFRSYRWNLGLPYWWASTGTTRNMSYDLRGDPYIPYMPVSPWYQSTIRPIRNRRMILI